MRCLLSILLFGAQAFGLACSSQQAQTVAHREPMEKPSLHAYKTPEHYEPRVTGYDPKTGDPITYDHKPRVEVLDTKSGKYAFKWIGLDGLEKVATFYRADAVDVLVSASVLKLLPDEYQYTYEVKNLPSSGTYLRRFIVQNFASEVKPAYGGDFLHFKMSKENRGYSEGNWIGFSDVSDHIQINPGQSVMIRLTSPAPPGLVECHASGETEVEGADEEMPDDMARLLGGYGEYLRGRTIGPVDDLKTLSTEAKIKYLLERLQQFRKLGWMTDVAFNRYERHLKSNDLNTILVQIDQDLKAEQITTEVFAIIQAMS